MKFSDIQGNSHIVSVLRTMASSGRIPHAMLFYENDGGGAIPMILAFLDYINEGRHSDIHFTFPITTSTKVSGATKDLTCDMFSSYWRELIQKNPYFLENEMSSALGFDKKTGNISAAEGRSILRTLSLRSMSVGYRAIVVYLPERMNATTANMLLKAIEEPAPGNLFLMVTHSPESVLQTISSRCQALRILPLPKEEVKKALVEKFSVPEEEAYEAALLAGGSIGAALAEVSAHSESLAQKDLFMDIVDSIGRRDYFSVLECGEKIAGLDSREKQKAFCNFAGECVRKIFMIQQGQPSLGAISKDELPFYEKASSSLPPQWCENALSIISRAATYLERNVNQKILFCAMATRLYTSAHPSRG